MFGKVKPENLPTYLSKIEHYFPEFQKPYQLQLQDVSQYYSDSFWGYAIFHSWAGAIHMALSRGETFTKNDYFGQVEEIAAIIASKTEDKKLRVLEVGCGTAFNLRYLAEQFPQHSFSGVDISERNLAAAKVQLESLPNATCMKDDFHSLSSIESNSMDLVFAIESLCHATNLSEALGAISRVLKPGGRLVVFDGFRAAQDTTSAQLRLAMQYTERAMAVPRFTTAPEFLSSAVSRNLVLESREDRSDQIVPNLVRLSDFAKGFFKIGPLAQVIMTLLPRALVANAIAGLLMAVTVTSGVHRYLKFVFAKENVG